MKRFAALLLFSIALVTSAARAEDFKPDDRVVFDVSAEDWVTTKTAHVTIAVDAAVSGNDAGAMRSEMLKAVNELAKADWRLTSFNRNQDQTGLERWSVLFDARLPEDQLNGLDDRVKKLGNAGMQLSVNNIDFSPTLDEMENARGALRSRIYKIANDQLAALNAALPGRNYRIAQINFTGDEGNVPMPRVVRGAMPMMAMASASSDAAPQPPMERSEKITQTARIALAATPTPVAVAPEAKR